MPRNLGNLAATPDRDDGREPSRVGGLPARPCGYHALGRGHAFAASDCVCALGIRSPIAGGEYPRMRIGVLLAGAYHARTSGGEALLGPGAMLLGNPGDAYEYRHVDDGGDRSLVFDYEADLLDDVGRSLGRWFRAGRGDKAFAGAAIPASASSARAAALAREALRLGDVDALHQAALAVLEVALTARAAGAAAAPRLSPRQERQIAQAMRYVEDHFADDCSLEALARLPGLSSFHFLRLFRAVTGQTPRQFVIAVRLRAAAASLRATDDAIVDVAMNAGFGDLSHFNASFARCFGLSPRAYRRR